MGKITKIVQSPPLHGWEEVMVEDLAVLEKLGKGVLRAALFFWELFSKAAKANAFLGTFKL